MAQWDRVATQVLANLPAIAFAIVASVSASTAGFLWRLGPEFLRLADVFTVAGIFSQFAVYFALASIAATAAFALLERISSIADDLPSGRKERVIEKLKTSGIFENLLGLPFHSNRFFAKYRAAIQIAFISISFLIALFYMVGWQGVLLTATPFILLMLGRFSDRFILMWRKDITRDRTKVQFLFDPDEALRFVLKFSKFLIVVTTACFGHARATYLISASPNYCFTAEKGNFNARIIYENNEFMLLTDGEDYLFQSIDKLDSISVFRRGERKAVAIGPFKNPCQ
jgi:hypothetical protein